MLAAISMAGPTPRTARRRQNIFGAFWEVESDQVVAALTGAMLEHGLLAGIIEQTDYEAAKKVADRLSGDGGIADIDALKPNAPEPTFDILARAIRESIDAGRPEEGLDRLHTFLVKYIRVLCEKHGIETPREKPLHSLFGEYVKRLQAEGVLRSVMTQRIMKSAISSLEAFNDVRNEQSLAHDNEVLRSHEALYIFNHIASLLRLLQVVEGGAPMVAADD
jgi:Abortive infection C-terminus